MTGPANEKVALDSLDSCSRCGYPRTRTACARCLYVESDPLEGLPPDLAALLRDHSVIVPQDAAVFELIAKWMDAPSDTASAMTEDAWRQAWGVTCRWMLEAQAERDRYLLLAERVRHVIAVSSGTPESVKEYLRRALRGL